MPEADSAARPSADDFLAIIRHQQIGKLKIYIGPSPGVGKTYAMLNEGRRLKQRGVDVVIGYVEPHGRVETERDDVGRVGGGGGTPYACTRVVGIDDGAAMGAQQRDRADARSGPRRSGDVTNDGRRSFTRSSHL